MAGKGHVFKRCGCTYLDEGVRKQYGAKCADLKRQNGSYNPRHGTWAFSIGVTVKGRRKQVLRSGFSTQGEAQETLDKLKAAHSRGVQITQRLTVQQYLAEWIVGKVDLRPNTRNSYQGQIQRHILPQIGHLRLDDLRTSDVAGVISNVKTGPATVQRVRACLRSALNDAIREGLILTNPAALVKMPADKRPKALVWTDERVEAYAHTGVKPSSVMVWTAAQLGAFLDFTQDMHLYAYWWLLAHRGLRRGEGLGLEWSDIDLNKGTLTVSRQRIKVRGAILETEPKSDAGGRTISLGTEGIMTLKAHKKRQGLRLAKVFTTPKGTPLDPGRVGKDFLRLIHESGLPPIRIHDLRHGTASLLLASGVDFKTIQSTLGHASISTTLNLYTSVYPEASQVSADAVAAIIPRRAL